MMYCGYKNSPFVWTSLLFQCISCKTYMHKHADMHSLEGTVVSVSEYVVFC